jgi:hypothetical protein
MYELGVPAPRASEWASKLISESVCKFLISKSEFDPFGCFDDVLLYFCEYTFSSTFICEFLRASTKLLTRCVRQAALVFSPPGLAELVSMYVTGGGNTISTEALVSFMNAQADGPDDTLHEVESLLMECGGLTIHPVEQVLEPYLTLRATDLCDNVGDAVHAFGFEKVYEFLMNPKIEWDADIERLLAIGLQRHEKTPEEMIEKLHQYVDNIKN